MDRKDYIRQARKDPHGFLKRLLKDHHEDERRLQIQTFDLEKAENDLEAVQRGLRSAQTAVDTVEKALKSLLYHHEFWSLKLAENNKLVMIE